MAKELFADYVKEEKLREPEEKKELAQTLKTFYVKVRKKGFVQCTCIIKQLLDLVFAISRIIKVSVRVITEPQPSASADKPYLDLNYLDITKTSSNDCLLFYLVPAVVLTLTLETSEVSAIFIFTTKSTQPCTQGFSVTVP